MKEYIVTFMAPDEKEYSLRVRATTATNAKHQVLIGCTVTKIISIIEQH